MLFGSNVFVSAAVVAVAVVANFEWTFFFSLAAGIDVAAAPTSFVDFVPTVAEIVFAVVVDADLR